MSILIKGMKMPTNEPLIVKINPNGSVSTTWKNDYKKYEAVPVPEHGRLIDATAKVQTQLYDDEHEEWTDAEMTVDEYLGYCFNEVPTIIPAESEGE